MRLKFDHQKIREFIESQSIRSKIYIGVDSERIKVNGKWFADYTIALVVHINGNQGCKIFGEVQREPDYSSAKDQSRPRLRLMTEAFKAAETYAQFVDVLEGRLVEIHLDLNTHAEHGSNCVLSEAIGYIRGTCGGITPRVKPDAWSATYAADRLKEILTT